MNIENLPNGYCRLSYDGGFVHDKRTGRLYSKVICSPRNVQHFEAYDFESAAV